jgi:uncharacterized protein YgbK (DUF1537 family)
MPTVNRAAHRAAADGTDRLLIVADDLTGAAEAGAAMAAQFRVELELGPVNRDADPVVLAVDTDSRHVSRESARSRVLEAIGLGAPDPVRVYKKIDSLGRGNVAAEVRATADALAARDGPTIAVVAPAFPALERTTVNGSIHVSGLPLRRQGRTARLAEMLGGEGFTSAELPRPRSPKDVITALEHAWREGLNAIVVDAETDDDLAAIATGSFNAGPRSFLVGSGGLARHLSGAIAAPEADPTSRARARTALTGPAVFIVGSRSATATRQRQALVAAGVHPVPVGDPPASDCVPILREQLERARHVVLYPDPAIPFQPARAGHMARALAMPVAAVLDAVGVVVATGGETARALLDLSGVHRLSVEEELEPGLVLSRSEQRKFTIITKAGAFGDANMLVRCLPLNLPIEEP